MNRLPFLLLGLLATALVAAIALQLDPPGGDGDGLPQAAPRRAAVPAAPVPAGAPERAGAWGATALARPLFSPDRRPAPPGAAAGRGAEAALPRLTGTLVTPAGRSALFAGTPAALVVREGGQVGAFTVRRIEPGQVTLEGPDGPRSLRPSFDPNRPAAPTASARTAAQAPPAGASSPPPSPPAPLPGRPPAGASSAGSVPPPGPSVPGPPIPANPPPGALSIGPSPEGVGEAEGTVPFEQNANPSGLDILRNMTRNAPPPPGGGTP